MLVVFISDSLKFPDIYTPLPSYVMEEKVIDLDLLLDQVKRMLMVRRS